MAEQTILFLHGFASSARGTKALYLGERCSALPEVAFHAVDFNPTPTDFAYMTTTGLINRLRQYILDRDLGTVHLIGSSYGGLIALHYAHRFDGIERMLLLAPAVRWLSGGLLEEELTQWEQAGAVPVHHYGFEKEIPLRFDLQVDVLGYLEPVAPAALTLIIHGRQDETVPIDDSRAYAKRFPGQVQLIEVEATHDLNDHLGFIWEQVQSFLLGG
jgi:pimeloyl-ACP methyl ester carboxylesterase